jgi:hypothetical protein
MRRSRRAGAAAIAVTALMTVTVPAASAVAHEVPTTATGASGQRLTVSATHDLVASGQTVTVTGTGYDDQKGIYVAFCVRPAAGQIPTPCGGGAATTGDTTSSAWISSDPPSYGKSLAKRYGADGSFSVQLSVNAALNDTTDCRRVTCAVVTRADHTRTSDRSQDVIVPISFAGPDEGPSALAIGGGVAAGVVVLAGLAVFIWQRRRTPRTSV